MRRQAGCLECPIGRKLVSLQVRRGAIEANQITRARQVARDLVEVVIIDRRATVLFESVEDHLRPQRAVREAQNLDVPAAQRGRGFVARIL